MESKIPEKPSYPRDKKERGGGDDPIISLATNGGGDIGRKKIYGGEHSQILQSPLGSEAIPWNALNWIDIRNSIRPWVWQRDQENQNREKVWRFEGNSQQRLNGVKKSRGKAYL